MSTAYSRGSATATSTLANTQFLAAAQAASRTRHALNPALRVEMETARAALRSLEALEQNWDGYGAKPITKAVRINAWHALDRFIGAGLIPEVSPNANGSVSLEWETDEVTAHFQVGRTTYSMYVRPLGGKAKYFNGNIKTMGNGPINALVREIGINDQFEQSLTRIDFRASREFSFA